MITKYINKLKENKKQKKEFKKKQKELAKQIEVEEKEIEKELPPEDKYNMLESFKLLLEKSEDDIEYESYLTEEEKKEEARKADAEKKITIIASVVFFLVIVFSIVGVNVYYEFFKADIYKITEPKLKEYYENKYGTKLERKSIERLSVYKDGKTIQSDITLLTTKDDKHIMCVKDELIGDDISISSVYEEALSYFRNSADDVNLIYDDVELSFEDYYLKYNRNIEYINTLPANKTFIELLDTKKLTLTYKLIYQNDINIEPYLDTIKKLTNESIIVLLKQERGNPVNLIVITKEKVMNLDVINYTDIDKDITVYDIDRTYNNIKTVSITKIVDNALGTSSSYALTNGYKIDFDRIYRYIREGEEEPITSDYYLIKFKNNSIMPRSLVQLGDYKRNDKYEELERENYEEAIFINVAGSTYLLSENKLFIATKTAKKTGLFG